MKHMIEEITSDRVHLESNFWTKIVERMYDSVDIEILEVKIRDAAQMNLQKPRSAMANGPSGLSLQTLLTSAK